MQPGLPTCEKTLKWVGEQAIPSLEDSFVTRCFPVFRGTTAGQSVDVVIQVREPASVDRPWAEGRARRHPMQSPIRVGGLWSEIRRRLTLDSRGGARVAVAAVRSVASASPHARRPPGERHRPRSSPRGRARPPRGGRGRRSDRRRDASTAPRRRAEPPAGTGTVSPLELDGVVVAARLRTVRGRSLSIPRGARISRPRSRSCGAASSARARPSHSAAVAGPLVSRGRGDRRPRRFVLLTTRRRFALRDDV
jgi:hypothetical protein